MTNTTAQPSVVHVVGARYPYQPVCPCGEAFWGYASAAAAELVLSAHVCGPLDPMITVTQ